MKQTIKLLPVSIMLVGCTLTIPLTEEESTPKEEPKTEMEVKKENAVNTKKVQADEKARTKQEQREGKSSEKTSDDGGGVVD